MNEWVSRKCPWSLNFWEVLSKAQKYTVLYLSPSLPLCLSLSLTISLFAWCICLFLIDVPCHSTFERFLQKPRHIQCSLSLPLSLLVAVSVSLCVSLSLSLSLYCWALYCCIGISSLFPSVCLSICPTVCLFIFSQWMVLTRVRAFDLERANRAAWPRFQRLTSISTFSYSSTC